MRLTSWNRIGIKACLTAANEFRSSTFLTNALATCKFCSLKVITSRRLTLLVSKPQSALMSHPFWLSVHTHDIKILTVYAMRMKCILTLHITR